MGIKVIITGSTGMVGEGVLLECLHHEEISQVLMVNRKHNPVSHPKLSECIAPDFLTLEEVIDQLSGYNACFYCAGISSSGMNEADYTRITFDTTMHFARTLAELNPGMIFIHVSGAMTDSSEAGKMMWARVKGRTENALMRLPFKMVYNFRPGFMKATDGQKNIKSYYGLVGWMYPILKILLPNYVSTLSDVGSAMIKCVLAGYPKQILEIKDINLLAK
jgi:hypothetical protein